MSVNSELEVQDNARGRLRVCVVEPSAARPAKIWPAIDESPVFERRETWLMTCNRRRHRIRRRPLPGRMLRLQIGEVAGRVEYQRTSTCQNVRLQFEEAHGRVHNEAPVPDCTWLNIKSATEVRFCCVSERSRNLRPRITSDIDDSDS